MKKIYIALIVILLVILVFMFILGGPKYVYFSETIGNVVDTEGNIISDAKVEISYLCGLSSGYLGGPEHSSIKSESILTDSNGNFRFNSWKEFVFRPPFRPCEKFITVYKEGYCKDMRLCLSEIESGAGAEVDFGGLYFYKGKYHDPFYFMERIKINSKSNQVSFILNKLP